MDRALKSYQNETYPQVITLAVGPNREFTLFPSENSRKSCRTFRAKADIVDMRSLNVLTWVTPVHR